MVSHLPAGHGSTAGVVHILHNLKLELFQHTSIHISWDMDLSIQIFIIWMCVGWIHTHHTHVLKKCMIKVKSMSHGYAQKTWRCQSTSWECHIAPWSTRKIDLGWPAYHIFSFQNLFWACGQVTIHPYQRSVGCMSIQTILGIPKGQAQ
jgi:hypothetical protein